MMYSHPICAQAKILKSSDWLHLAASYMDAGLPVPPIAKPEGWADYVRLTYPPEDETYAPLDWERTKVLRWLLASAIAESEGR